MVEEKTTERSEFDIPLDEEEVTVEPAAAPEENYKEKYEHEHDLYLRLAAEYDNFRKRSQKEKDSAYTNGKADTLTNIRLWIYHLWIISNLILIHPVGS